MNQFFNKTITIKCLDSEVALFKLKKPKSREAKKVNVLVFNIWNQNLYYIILDFIYIFIYIYIYINIYENQIRYCQRSTSGD